LHCGEAVQARQIIKEAYLLEPATAHAEEWMQLRDVTAWPDAWLIATVRREPPDEAALDALVQRYWKVLFGRCQMLTLNQTSAADLAQEAWRRVLRTRHRLNPGGRFAAYLITIATNLWRDSQRAAGRAGPLALNRLASLDDSLSGDEHDTITLMDVLPDLQTSHEHERRLLAQEIDHALGHLTPLLREVLTARFLSGESCAEIGRRHGRTEQTISGWVRAAIQQMKFHLTETSRAAEPTNL
jgi:RNA polymerase sigma factor (sigma-70 family)